MRRILLVEDDDDCRTIYLTALQHAGFEVLVCADGWTAVQRACEERPDLILMDIAIPGIDGFEATRILKSDHRTKSIPVFGVTARVVPEYQRRARESRFEIYLHKPLTLNELLAHVHALLGQS